MSGPGTDGDGTGDRDGNGAGGDGGDPDPWREREDAAGEPDDGIVATVAATPTAACPGAALATAFTVVEFVPGEGGNAPKFVVESDDRERLAARDAVTVAARGDDLSVCAIPALATATPSACGHDRCLCRGLGFLPVQPYRRRWRDGRLLLDVAADGRTAVEGIVERLREAGHGATTERIVRGGVAAEGDTALVELRSLTQRQREVAAYATARGYFDSDGPSAATLAEEFDIAPATLSEHLRTAETALFEQVFNER